MPRVNVTKSFLPPFEEYSEYLKQIWENVWLTNEGPLLEKLESDLTEYLSVPYLQLVGNGTLALQLALRTLDITDGEVITTPFTYVATTSSILWEHCKPVFVDIEPESFCINPTKIEAAITPQTKAIMPVHVFGNPCDTDAIEAIAKKHNLKIIYDAAHAFGATYKGKSLFDYGDISIGSFHATKLFHTIEGGCLVMSEKTLNDTIELMKRFGHNGDDYYMLGINAKANEFQAAMGLCNLKYIDKIITLRKEASDTYDQLLDPSYHRPKPLKGTTRNYAYYPILCQDEAHLLAVTEALAKADIHPRRYFYPSLNKLPYIEQSADCPVSEDISSRVLCLPLWASMDEAIITAVCQTLNDLRKA